MEENEKIKTENNSKNNVNQQNGSSEIKPKNKNVTIVLISVIMVLVLAIGVCIGLWFAGDTTKIINKSEEKQEQVKEDIENKVEKLPENVEKEDVENSNNEQENNNVVVQNGNVLGLEGQFIDVETAAIINKDIDTHIVGNNDIEVDLNNDGKKEKLTLFIGEDEENSIYCNISIDGGEIIETIEWAESLLGVVVVDIDKSDNYLDFITMSIVGNGAKDYDIYKFNGKHYSKIENICAYNLYVDQKGKIVTQNSSYVESNPIIASSYFSYKEEKYIDIDLSKYSNIKISFRGSFTEDYRNEEKVWKEEYDGNMSFTEHLKKCGIIDYDSVNGYLLDIVETDYGSKYKVKLEDGTVGYFVGPWAG